MSCVALVRRPSPRLAEGIVTHIERTAVDLELARRQHAAYVDALAQNGWRPREVPLAEDCPDSVFVEDTVVICDDLAVLTRSGAVVRRPEVEAVAETVRKLGLRIERIEEPGTLDGGDVLQIGRTVYVGLGGRTNDEGVAQLAGRLRRTGRTVVAVPVVKVLHLKSAVTALPDGTVLTWGDLIDPAPFPRRLEVPEEAGAHVVTLDDERLIISASAPRTAELLAKRGYRPITVDISEYERLEGCVTCLSVLIA